MSAPSEARQVGMLLKVQCLLEEGSFTATYKFALLQALVDISVERGADDDSPLVVPTRLLAEKFIVAFWPQVRPFERAARHVDPGSRRQVFPDRVAEASGTPAIVARLRHGTQSDDAIPRLVRALADEHDQSLPAARVNAPRWSQALTRVRAIVCTLPLWHLQQIGRRTDDFLYAQPSRQRVVEEIALRPGVAFTMRRFQHLLRELVRGAWIAFIRGLQSNRTLFGEADDLHEFLFGQRRKSLEACRAPLVEAQDGRCLYCSRRVRVDEVHVDHFIPWARFPSNLVHNLVAAHATCNHDKSNHLVAVHHLRAWRGHVAACGSDVARALAAFGLLADACVTLRIASWAYGQVAASGASVWSTGRELVPLDETWSDVLCADARS